MGCLVSAEVECIQCSLFKKVIKPPLNITQLYQCNFDTESGKIHEKEWQSTFLKGDLNPVSWMTILFSNPWLSMTGNYLKMNSKYLRIDLRCHWLLLINYLNQIKSRLSSLFHKKLAKLYDISDTPEAILFGMGQRTVWCLASKNQGIKTKIYHLIALISACGIILEVIGPLPLKNKSFRSVYVTIMIQYGLETHNFCNQNFFRISKIVYPKSLHCKVNNEPLDSKYIV